MILSPHAAWYTEESQADLRRKVGRGGRPNARRSGTVECSDPTTGGIVNPQSISDLTSPEVKALVARSKTAIIPIGSVEQHGPHLPCGTDTIASEVVAEALAGRLDALLVPFGPVRCHPDPRRTPRDHQPAPLHLRGAAHRHL
jgi:hypothetical protein